MYYIKLFVVSATSILVLYFGSTRVGSDLDLDCNNLKRIKLTGVDKYSSLIRYLNNNQHKKFYNFEYVN